MRIALLLAMMVMLAFSVGCRKGGDVQRVESSTMTTASEKQFNAQDVRKAIVNACAFRGWQVKELSPGLLEATLRVRGKHTVVVDIPYTAKGFAINYKNSINMDYKTKSDGTYRIHPNYNKWVNTLQMDINNQLTKTM